MTCVDGERLICRSALTLGVDGWRLAVAALATLRAAFVDTGGHTLFEVDELLVGLCLG